MTNQTTTTPPEPREPTDIELAEALACIREFVLSAGPITDARWSEGLAWGLSIEYTAWDLDLARRARPSKAPARWLKIAQDADKLRAHWGCPARFVVVKRKPGVAPCR